MAYGRLSLQVCVTKILNVAIINFIFLASIPVFFPERPCVAFAAQSLFNVLGMAIGFLWGNLLFVRTKTIINLTVTIFGAVLFVVAECVRRYRADRCKKDYERVSILPPSSNYTTRYQ